MFEKCQEIEKDEELTSSYQLTDEEAKVLGNVCKIMLSCQWFLAS